MGPNSLKTSILLLRFVSGNQLHSSRFKVPQSTTFCKHNLKNIGNCLLTFATKACCQGSFRAKSVMKCRRMI